MSDKACEQADSLSAAPSWRRSSYSGPEGGECLEVAIAPVKVRVRDSKAPQVSLAFESGTWARFLRFATQR
ncbi:DUF397 domain-containing protein [Streptomyces sp. NPDC093991]|uniref:DUF397 domain-containing protein n=1 Tax=unclassified Streptomyces TaxID=2593676 RepID=UPI0034227625